MLGFIKDYLFCDYIIILAYDSQEGTINQLKIKIVYIEVKCQLLNIPLLKL